MSLEAVYRTHYCGALTSHDVASQVVVCGWVQKRREHGEKLAFIDLRDHTGTLQCVVDEKLNLRTEFVIKISGTLRDRPEGTENPNMATGHIELGDCEVEILNPSEPPPFPIDERVEVDEVTRLRHRYVDLRSRRMQENLRTRADVNTAIRESMSDQGFLELETPLLIASTPEGARDFVVPSRLHQGSFYALPQSPQIFKQLSMVGGMDRYYQIARCLRDEDLRADRQFEFTQLDMEASFVNAVDVMDFVTETVKAATEAVLGFEPGNFVQMTYAEAMNRFGTDKPDLRFEMELTDISSVFSATEARVFQAEYIKALKVPGEEISRNDLDELTKFAISLGAKGLAWFRVLDDSVLDGPMVKFLSEAELTQLIDSLSAAEGDLILAVADTQRVANQVLGQIRVRLGKPQTKTPESDKDLNFVWVTDFPLFEDLDDQSNPIPAHHLFTMPHPEDINRLVRGGGEGLLAIRSLAYDLVLNGWELGSGSIRIHETKIQEQVFAALGMDEAEAQMRFGYILEAFKFGAPPHGGFAMGIDRFVALMVGEENIREVIAFPKTQSGVEPMSGAPSPISEAHLKELGLAVIEPPEKS